MIFNCKAIFITNETYGCSITFSENENFKNIKINDYKQNQGQYLMLMRKYKEDELEEDYVYLEMIDPLKSGELNDFVIHIYPNKFTISYEKAFIEINLNIDDNKLEYLKDIIYKITNKNGLTNFHN